MIELHTWDTPNGRKVSVALEEMGLPYQVQPVDITAGAQFDPAFVSISPNNRIPAIVDPEGPGAAPISVFESGAILLYLGEKTGLFMPNDRRERVAVLQWLMWPMGGFGPMPGQVHHFLGMAEADRAYGARTLIRRRRTGYTACWTGSWRRSSSWQVCSWWQISRSWAGRGGMNGTAWIWPTIRTCGAGMML